MAAGSSKIDELTERINSEPGAAERLEAAVNSLVRGVAAAREALELSRRHFTARCRAMGGRHGRRR
jgi:hypothetical protein